MDLDSRDTDAMAQGDGGPPEPRAAEVEGGAQTGFVRSPPRSCRLTRWG